MIYTDGKRTVAHHPRQAPPKAAGATVKVVRPKAAPSKRA